MYNGAVCFVSLAIRSDFLSIHALLSNLSSKSCSRRQEENNPAPCLACPHPSQSNFTKSALPHSCTNYLTKAATHRSCTVKAGKDRAFYQRRAGQSPSHIFRRQSLIEKFYHILPLHSISAAPWFNSSNEPEDTSRDNKTPRKTLPTPTASIQHQKATSPAAPATGSDSLLVVQNHTYQR